VNSIRLQSSLPLQTELNFLIIIRASSTLPEDHRTTAF
jgi:hypothetical protein